MNWTSRQTARLAILTAITVAGEGFGMPQLFTGPFINAMLLLSAKIVSPAGGVALGCITPPLALLSGHLPFIAAPLIPFIMIGNGLYVVLFSTLHSIRAPQKRLTHLLSLSALCTAAAVKALWLTLAVYLLLPYLFGVTLPQIMVAAMTVPQFFTALAGGAAALALYAVLRRLGIVFDTHPDRGRCV